jgi:phosphoesterase RecJ-like protein
MTNAGHPLIAGHVSPDIDVLGSMLALVRSMPCEAPAISLPGASASQKLLFMRELAGHVPLAGLQHIENADTFIVVDTATPKRIHVQGQWEAVADKFIVNIDHHITNSDFGSVNWVVDNASSTCELIYHLIRTADWPLDQVTASLLYAGIYADTGGFSLPNATPQAFEVAAELVRAGADIERLGAKLYRSQAPHEFELVRTVYHNTRLTGNKKVAYSTLSYDEIIKAGASPDDIDDQVSIPRSLSGIRTAILFSEGQPGVVRINLRGENGTPVLPLAEILGGGGHTFSAGVRMRGDLNEVVRKVLHEANKLLDE